MFLPLRLISLKVPDFNIHIPMSTGNPQVRKKFPVSVGKAGFILGHICLCFIEKQIWLITSFPWSRKTKCMLKEGAEKSETNVDFNGKAFSWVNGAGSRNSHPGSEQHHPSFNIIPNYRTTFFGQLRPRDENSWVSSLLWSWAAVCGGFVSSPLLPQDGLKSCRGWAESTWCPPDGHSQPAWTNTLIMISWV